MMKNKEVDWWVSLKIVKNHLRSCMLQPRLTSLSIMSSESDLLEDIDFSDIVRSFVEVTQEALLVGNKLSILSNMSNVGVYTVFGYVV